MVQKIKLTFLTGVLIVIAAHIPVSGCNKTKHNYAKSPEERRQILINKIISKMNDLSLYTFHNYTLKDIQEKIQFASKFTGPRKDAYIKILTDGIQSILASKNNLREIETANSINPSIQNSLNDELEYISNAEDESIGELKATTASAEYEEEKVEEDICDCSCVEERLCLNISSLDEFTCHKEQNIISLSQMCDGEKDCIDNSDEILCRVHANKQLSKTKLVLNYVQNVLPKYCLEVQNSVDKVVMKTRKETLTRVLKKQLEVVNSVTPIKFLKRKEGKQIKEVREITQLVSSITAALEGALCIRDKYKIIISRRNGLIMEGNLDLLNNKKTWAPPLCTCIRQFCVQKDCTAACNNTCWQRYSLGQWVCQTIGGARSVSIDLVCDGKADCSDESDEKGCKTGAGAEKFQATQIYNSIIEFLATEIAPGSEINKVINLRDAVKYLQAQSIKEVTDAASLKRLGDEAFSGILALYDDVLTKAENVLKVDAEYNSLIFISQKLIEAMKLSKTANGTLIQSNECHCMSDKCLMTECTASCVRFCAVQSAITEYSCKSNSSARIPVQNLCDGKIDCLEGDDEQKCQEDICRNHHLRMLRNKIQNYKDERWGNALAEILENWKTKTISSIEVYEKMGRMPRQGVQKLVGDTLLDLVQAYSSLPRLTRRSSAGSVPAFLQLAGLIKDTLRDCTI